MANAFDIIMKTPAVQEHWIKRGIAFIVDLIAIFIIYFIIAIIVVATAHSAGWGSVSLNPFSTDTVRGAGLGANFLIACITSLFALFYFVIMESNSGVTIGKNLAGLKVTSLKGPMDLSKAFTRNMTKLGAIFFGAMLGGSLFLYAELIGFLFLDVFFGVGSTSDTRQKYTDKLSGTLVVRTDIDERPEDLEYKQKIIIPPPVSASPEPASKDTSEASPPEVSASEVDKLADDEKETIKKYQEFFGISEERALNLHKAGYKSLDDFKDAIVDDLVLVDKINPTVARGILKKVESL
ncbi:MAG: RDD family protein [Thermoplasmata archaeon]|nr:MAG: RDD family protein [Thermoplasmata archaeon]